MSKRVVGTTEAAILKQLQIIPGVGRSIAQDLYNLNIHAVSDLKGRNPQTLYEELCVQNGQMIDRCMLYVFRCAVYYASTDLHDPDLLKWWHWKDRQTITELLHDLEPA